MLGALQAGFAAELERGFLWAPVFVAIGIVWFFAMASEPPIVVIAVLAALCVVAAVAALWASERNILRGALWSLALVTLGFSAAAWRTHHVAAPVLGHRYYGPVEGRVIGLDRSASGALRVTLDTIRLGNRPEQETPGKLRFSIFGPDADQRPLAGAYVMTTAYLSPPNGPAEPGGFDFRRYAWFQGVGAVGYTRLPVLLARDPPSRRSAFSVRLAVSDRIRAVLPGQTGAFAAALMSGDRSGLSPETLRSLRRTNLAHLLAISGLHMGLLAGVVFAAMRVALGLIPVLAHSGWSKKLAAFCALIAAAGYMILSGGSVATERAFIMAAVALGAIMLDRRAISLRAVAIAALVVMMFRPEAVLSPGFQMSFAATTALVVTFQILARRMPASNMRVWIWRAVSGTVLTSAVAGLATLPIAAAHFNAIAHYGLLANLSSVPLMGLWIMPLAVLAVCLMPFGYEALALKPMGMGLDWILYVARHVEAWPGATGKIVSPDGTTFLALCLGLCVLAVSATQLRWVGAALCVAALALWTGTDRPDVLIAADGKLVGVQTGAGRALSKAEGAGFVAGIWLENDGDPSVQAVAARRWDGKASALRTTRVAQRGSKIIAASGKTGLRAFQGCAQGDVAVFSEPAPSSATCLVFDKDSLEKSGAIALQFDPDRLKITTARESAGRRIWNTPALRKQAKKGRQ